MAVARVLARRLPLASIVITRNPSQVSPFIEQEWRFSSMLNISLRNFVAVMGKKGIMTQTSSSIQSDGEVEDCESNSADTKSVTEVARLTETSSNGTSMSCTSFSNLKVSKRHDLAMIFTCKVCETRSVKTVCRESYEKGVVVARCGGCNNLHLIADHLGWFGEPVTVEEILAARGEEVKKGSLDTLNLTLEDIVGGVKQSKDK